MSYEQLLNDANLFKFYTGITVHQFSHLYQSLGQSVHKLKYWLGSSRKETAIKKLTPENKLLLT